jgi:hypothetical protein
MELPDELYLEIFTHLPQHHLRSVSQTCRTFATLVRPLKFKTIHLDGFPQSRFGRMEKDECVMYPGRSRTVELSALDSTVNELITLDIARHVQALKFSPKYYVDGELSLWTCDPWQADTDLPCRILVGVPPMARNGDIP